MATNGEGANPLYPVQLGLLEDLSGRCLQERFREFCGDAIAALLVSNDEGLILEAEKHAAKLTISVEIRRVSGRTEFSVSSKVATKLPSVPGVSHTFKASRKGLVQEITPVQLSMFPNVSGA